MKLKELTNIVYGYEPCEIFNEISKMNEPNEGDITRSLIEVFSKGTMNDFRKNKELSQKYAKYNVVMIMCDKMNNSPRISIIISEHTRRDLDNARV